MLSPLELKEINWPEPPVEAPALTTAQRLDIIKSPQDHAKDKGLNDDLDGCDAAWTCSEVPRHDIDGSRKDAELAAGHRPIIEAPYRWRDWAADADGIPGPDLLSFLVSEMTERPDDTRAGLFAYLEACGITRGERRDVIVCLSRLKPDGERLPAARRRQLIDGIPSTVGGSPYPRSPLRALLRGRDAAGTREFYTPGRVRFAGREQIPSWADHPRPACGTEDFDRAFQHLERQTDTVETALCRRTPSAARPSRCVPSVPAQPSHGLCAHRRERPSLSLWRRSAKSAGQCHRPIRHSAARKQASNNFPEDRRTAETALLFCS